MLSYGISYPFQPDFVLPLISHHNGVMDMIDPDQFIDVGLFLKSAVQISDACFVYQYKKTQNGKTL